jgi:phosphoserine phosphatase
MKIILTRHGETIENTIGIIQGHLHGVLSGIGLTQAEKLADTLASVKIDYIYSSDLRRASETCSIIAKKHLSVPVKYLTELRERYFGSLEGKVKSEIFGYPFSINLLNADDVESLDELLKRAHIFFSYLISNHNSDTVLIVAHNTFNKCFITSILENSVTDLLLMNNFSNASITQINFTDRECFKFEKYNNVAHLE